MNGLVDKYLLAFPSSRSERVAVLISGNSPQSGLGLKLTTSRQVKPTMQESGRERMRRGKCDLAHERVGIDIEEGDGRASGRFGNMGLVVGRRGMLTPWEAGGWPEVTLEREQCLMLVSQRCLWE